MITINNKGLVEVRPPRQSAEFEKQARELGGVWGIWSGIRPVKVWTFDAEVEEQVRSLVRRVFGSGKR